MTWVPVKTRLRKLFIWNQVKLQKRVELVASEANSNLQVGPTCHTFAVRGKQSVTVCFILDLIVWEPRRGLGRHPSVCVWVSHGDMTLESTFGPWTLPIWCCSSSLFPSFWAVGKFLYHACPPQHFGFGAADHGLNVWWTKLFPPLNCEFQQWESRPELKQLQSR